MTAIENVMCFLPMALSGAAYLAGIYIKPGNRAGTAVEKYVFVTAGVLSLASCAFIYLYMAGPSDIIGPAVLLRGRLILFMAAVMVLLAPAFFIKEKNYFTAASACLFCAAATTYSAEPAVAAAAFIACDLTAAAALYAQAGDEKTTRGLMKPKLFFSAAAAAMTAAYYAAGTGKSAVTALAAAAAFMMLSATHTWFTVNPRVQINGESKAYQYFHPLYIGMIIVQVSCLYAVFGAGLKPVFAGVILLCLLSAAVYRALTEEDYQGFTAADTAALGALVLFVLSVTDAGMVTAAGLFTLVAVYALACGCAVTASRPGDFTIGALKYKTAAIKGAYPALAAYIAGLWLEVFAFITLFSSLKNGQVYLLLAIITAAVYTVPFLNRLFGFFSIIYRLIQGGRHQAKPGIESLKFVFYAALFLAFFLRLG
ncbi:MAG: hypothetical protein LLG37_09330 [Spirochaetia bacterium]|nr:hypothetical protein [Spirochaetia bacterium]